MSSLCVEIAVNILSSSKVHYSLRVSCTVLARERQLVGESPFVLGWFSPVIRMGEATVPEAYQTK
jgi:hypothetical protein